MPEDEPVPPINLEIETAAAPWDGAEATEITTGTWTVEAIAGGGSRSCLVHDGWNGAGPDAGLRDDHDEHATGFLEDLPRALEEA